MTDEGRRRTKAPSAPLPDATERADGEERAPQPGPAQESREQPEAIGESREQPEATETEVARATEPGAWAAIHARQVRGRRPGRRGRRPAPPAEGGLEAPEDDRQGVIVAASAPLEALLERSPAPVSDEAMAAAAADEEVAPARRRRRGRRGRGGGAASAAASGERLDEGETTERAARDGAAAPLLEVTQVAAEELEDDGLHEAAGASAEAGDEALGGSGGAGDEEPGGDGRKRRHRGHRGGRRHRRKNGEPAVDEAEAAGEAPAAAEAGEDGAASGEPDAAPAALTVEERPAEGSERGGAAEPTPVRRSRRRGRRRGGDDGGAATEAATADDEPRPAAAVPAEKTGRADAEPGETVGRRRGGRLRRPKESTVTADLPGYKEILVSEEAGEMRVALVEDGRLAEIYIERPGKRSYAGNIYRGKVDNVLPGMDAAFVDIGLERNGFLYVDDVADPDNGEKRPHKITQMLKPGQELLVQVSKDPMGSKGARLTGQLSLAGRYLVYVPGGSGVGVSRRLPADERDRLRELCKSLKTKDAGLIVRTVAEGKSVEEMKNDLRFLSRLWARLKTKAEKVKAPGLLYAEADVSLQVARDLYNESFSAVLVDDAKRRKELVAYLEKVAPELATRVKPYDGDEPLFRAHGIEEQISKALERRVPLPSGGNLVIDHTEALTVIDVNTGRFTGGKGLEDTITRNNLEAAREVVRQLRLRDIGGIIIIDFIDMEYARNREAVLAKLQAELETDRTKTYVVEISPLGLVEMTRQNITDGARGILTQTCPFCEGKARILSAETMAISVERRLGEHAAETQAKALLIEVNTAVAERLTAGGRIKRLEKNTGKRFFLEGSKLLPIETFRIVAEGSLDAVDSHRIPVREDQEVTVELEYALTYSPGDAVAHVDGFQLIVLNGRRALGDKRKVRITSLTRAGAMGVLLS
ncbi:MAG: Rne/Rng family ribonuclease [Thermoleophilia bacterium]